MVCSRCKKRMAVVFMSRMEGGETINEGLCLQCAKELGIPQVQQMMDSMGISDDDIEMMSDQMMALTDDDGDSFEPGGADMMLLASDRRRSGGDPLRAGRWGFGRGKNREKNEKENGGKTGQKVLDQLLHQSY